MTWYSIHLTDSDGYTIRETRDFDTNKRKAIAWAKDMLSDPEYKDAHRVEVLDDENECVWDDEN